MRFQLSEKLPAGKLVRVAVDFDKIINSVTITGDFFLHPEDKLELIENALSGLPLAIAEEDLRRRVEFVVEAEGIEMAGITPEAIARLVKQATAIKESFK